MILENIELAHIEDSMVIVKIKPFIYQESGKKPRLPRKSSKGYHLITDTNLYFATVLKNIDIYSCVKRFKIQIYVYAGNDGLGKADLDNYSKAILDGITSSNKIWKDDKQVDDLQVKRFYKNDSISYVTLKIVQL